MVRRFRLPRTQHHSSDAFWVEDADGKRFAYCYFKARPDQVDSDSLLSREEARRLTAKIARLPDLLDPRP